MLLSSGELKAESWFIRMKKVIGQTNVATVMKKEINKMFISFFHHTHIKKEEEEVG